jgi:metal-responsive CopG/Arc/MetJ family transcriptional regulator
MSMYKPDKLTATKQLKRYVYPIQLDEEEVQALNDVVERTGRTKSEAIREAIRRFAEEIRGMEVVRVRDISTKQARKEILDYLSRRERAWSSEIADTLRLDLTVVNAILEELWGEKRIEPTT